MCLLTSGGESYPRLPVATSRRVRRRLSNFISEKFSQPAFETHFSGCAPL